MLPGPAKEKNPVKRSNSYWRKGGPFWSKERKRGGQGVTRSGKGDSTGGKKSIDMKNSQKKERDPPVRSGTASSNITEKRVRV